MTDQNNSRYSIETQKEKVFGKKPTLKLLNPCKIGSGILEYDEVKRKDLIQAFEKKQKTVSFFIPASGSGSRMFQFLYEFLNQPDENNVQLIERFFNNFENFAFYRLLPKEIKELNLDDNPKIEEIILYILEKEGLNFANYPKGLIPFHKNGPFILNPYQEQVLQAINLLEDKVNVHFTINENFENEIKHSIQNVTTLVGKEVFVDFSYQKKETDAISFYKDESVVKDDNGIILTRPAGHGALLSNLNEIESDFIFLKNIDNVQNYNHSQKSKDSFKFLGGIALEFQKEMTFLQANPSVDQLFILNAKYQLLDEKLIEDFDQQQILDLINRPFRICGMIKNEGQPGGGPFWVEENGIINKQIIEKAQIENSFEQLKLLVQSTHFNPVMMVACPMDLNGNKFDLMDFSDESKYFLIEKKFKGKSIYFSELPGLWNGSMAKWNTVFVEIPSDTFSPVKTVLDLLNKSHLED
ncbi:MAG: DUF4301 family protein [Flavobacteriia bacterium]